MTISGSGNSSSADDLNSNSDQGSPTLHILVIDDDKVDRQLIRRIFQKSIANTTIDESENVTDGLALLKQKHFDCVLMDYRMPVYDGLKGLAEVRKINPYVPVVMVTGQGDEILAVTAIQCGAYTYIPKDKLTAESLWNAMSASIENGKLRKKIDQQREELENFGRILAHDLKAPIRMIRSFNALISQAISEQNYDEIGDYFDRVERSANHMDELIDTLQEYSKLESNEVTFEAVCMNTVLLDVINNLQVVIDEAGAEVRYADLPYVNGNSPQLIQLVQNLVANGIKYCEQDDPLIEISSEKKGDYQMFSIRDNGIGIPEKHRKYIFEPFKRLHGSDRYSGTGLGLATCKKIVSRHSGKIWCDSVEGKGSVFFFTLPASSSEAA